jgi:hypothetical protein
MAVSDSDVEISNIMSDTTLSLVARIRRKQELLNSRFLAHHAHQDDKQQDKVQIAHN